MKPSALLLAVALPCLASAQYTYQQLQVDFLEKDSSAKRYTYGNLRLYPVYAKPAFRNTFKNVGSYTSLPDAIQQKKVRIREKPQGGTVNRLTIENTSNDTIFVICGDVVKGGQQDRIVEADLVLAPRSGKKELQVFCVESGRWSATRMATSNRQRATTSEVRTVNIQAPDIQAEAPRFEAHFNKGSMGLRKVVEKEKDQGKVWSKVEEVNVSNATLTSTKTYTAINQSNSYAKKLERYLKAFRNRFVKDTGVIGVVVVSGNKVLGCDLFATPALFRSQFPSLLHSYATEAIVNGKPVTVQPSVVKSYMDKLLRDEASQKLVLKEKGGAFVDRGRKLRVSSYD